MNMFASVCHDVRSDKTLSTLYKVQLKNRAQWYKLHKVSFNNYMNSGHFRYNSGGVKLGNYCGYKTAISIDCGNKIAFGNYLGSNVSAK